MGNVVGYDSGLSQARAGSNRQQYQAQGGPQQTAGTNFLRDLSDYLARTMANTNANARQQTDLLSGQIGMLQGNQQTQAGYINQDQGFGTARIGLNREGLGVQQGALNRATALLPQQHALTLQGLQDQLAQAKYGAGMQRRSLGAQATVQGATVSTGARQGFKDIMKQLGFSKKDIRRATRSENLGFGERQASLADQQKQLNLASRGLDMDAQELQSRTQRALEQLGLSTAISVNDIMRAINDVNAGRFNVLQQYLGPIYQAGGPRPVAG